MCGIAGVFASGLPTAELARTLDAMNTAQAHRGPDESGTVLHQPLGAGLASCRLSIVDPEHGRQPIANEDESVHVVLNGEIYNHGPLREFLLSKGHQFRSRSDTEVLVHLYEELGEELLDRLEGMFALAVLDTRRARLLLARDGPGMKPLYLAQTQHGFLFASEAKALFATRLVSPQPDPASIDTYLTMGYVPAPMSMFRGVQRLQAGRFAVVDRGGLRERTFWRLRYEKTATRKPDQEYAEELETILGRAVRLHFAADVPVGAFLSGGWDSSLTATFAARAAGRRLNTFSVVFPEDPHMDESRYSRQMAKHLGTDHHEIEYRSNQMPPADADPAPGGTMYGGSGGRRLPTGFSGGQPRQDSDQRGRRGRAVRRIRMGSLGGPVLDPEGGSLVAIPAFEQVRARAHSTGVAHPGGSERSYGGR
jgi:asparagine synthase (glutamine-hydrolysing)